MKHKITAVIITAILSIMAIIAISLLGCSNSRSSTSIIFTKGTFIVPKGWEIDTLTKEEMMYVDSVYRIKVISNN